LLAGVAGARPDARAIAVLTLAAVSGGWLCRAMLTERGLLGRLLLHWASFAGTVAWLVPRAIATAVQAAPGPLSLRLAALAVLGPTLALAWAGTSAFARAGGTPEPLDAPPRLAVDGVFSRVRNPIQLAEMGLVIAAALWWPHPATAAWALAFVALLVGPVRLHEERRLRTRFGLAYDVYRARTPAYWPRLDYRATRKATPRSRIPGRMPREGNPSRNSPLECP
jgi:protein-S-isoprenylcysteine O-methyltransferase Ste14